MTKPLRVGLIGANPNGGWARESHIPALQALSGIELAAVVGRDQRRADAAAHAFGVGKAYGDVASLVRDPDIDIVTVAATLPSHQDLLLPAMAAGKHVYCEYPLGLDAKESRTLAEAAARSGRRSAIGLQTRANPALRAARDQLAAGAIGRPLTARVLSTTAGFGPAVDPAFAYTEEPANGVTVITIQSAHTIDAVIALLGAFSELDALTGRQFPQVRIGDGPAVSRRTFDHLLVQGRTSSGTALSVEVAGGRTKATPFRFEIIGETGELVLEGGAPRGFQSGRLALFLNGEKQTVDEGSLESLPDAALNVAASYAVLRDDIVQGSNHSVGFDHAVRLATLIEDAVRSSETGRRSTGGDWPQS